MALQLVRMASCGEARQHGCVRLMAASSTPRLTPLPFEEWDEQAKTVLLPTFEGPSSICLAGPMPRRCRGARAVRPPPPVDRDLARLQRVVRGRSIDLGPGHQRAGRAPRGVAHTLRLRVVPAHPHRQSRRSDHGAASCRRCRSRLRRVDARRACHSRGGRRDRGRCSNRGRDVAGAGRSLRPGPAPRTTCLLIGSYFCLASVINSSGLPADPPTEPIDAPSFPTRDG